MRRCSIGLDQSKLVLVLVLRVHQQLKSVKQARLTKVYFSFEPWHSGVRGNKFVRPFLSSMTAEGIERVMDQADILNAPWEAGQVKQ